ncbi:hypothetical protein [Clostridium tagluense]|uniref:hypothetical protein n=1 Tax=Clostridium tagluense TaxID=360422 RepID=UPI001CF26290|nr:hypothetical protein [Clostridium tagluense]MCB2298883.1 hypothetical protein [Clostridium tagluense]
MNKFSEASILEYYIYKNPKCILKLINENTLKKTYMEVPLINGLKRDFIIETIETIIIGEIMLKPDPLKKHVDYTKKDVSMFKGKYVRYVIVTDYSLDTKAKAEFNDVVGESNLNLYNIIVTGNRYMEVNWEIGKGNSLSQKLQFCELVNTYVKNDNLAKVIDCIKLRCDFKNFHNFSFCKGRTERFGSNINDLEFYINCNAVDLKYNSIKKFNSNKDFMENIIRTIGVWKYNKKFNGIYIPIEEIDECCDIINKTIKLLDIYS